MKRYLLLPVLVLVLFTTFISTAVLEQSSWAGHETELPALSSPEERNLNVLPYIFLLFTGSDEPEPITAIAGASPANGPASLTVQFTTDSSGPVEIWRWDFNGDGSWDWEGNSAENRSYIFAEAGSYIAVLQVEDTHGNTDDAQVVISVTEPAPVITLTGDDSQLFSGQSTTLRWSVTGATSFTIDQGIGLVSSDGSQSVSPSATTVYTLTATGPGGTRAADVEVIVVDPEPEDLVVYIHNPEDGQAVVGSTMTITGGVNQPTAQVWINSVAATVTEQTFSAEVPLVAGVNSLYATASYNDLTAADSVWVVRDFIYTPQPDGSFGEQYEDLVPDDSGIPSYDKDRFSVITGLVENEQSSPVQGAAVTIKNHPEYGTAHTDTTGRFSLPVESGTTHTVIYQHDSYLTAHRKIEVQRNDIGIVDLVRLVVQDSAVTTVSFDGNPDTVVTHISSLTTDTYGSRAMTMVFQGDNHAWEVDDHGQRIRELSTIATRVTEFTTPEAMPSVLPPNSAFTYCSELSVDGVARIEFDAPVVTWVDNFLGFAVGEIVPVGYYDRDAAAWVPSDNGIVVQLLDLVGGDGIVDALDVDGDGNPDDLDGDTFFNDEVIGLGDAGRYHPGDTYWRVEVSHFTPWDHNWPFLPPPDAEPPDPDEEPEVDEQDTDTEKDDCDEEVASSIEPRSRIFHEDISVPGTDISLHYTSNRVSGYQHVITIPVSGATVPGSLQSIRVKVEVAGVVKNWVFYPPLSNRHVTLSWDGYDYLGRLVTSPIDAHIALGYVYKGYYANRDEMSAIDQAFAQPGLYATTVPAREEIVVWKDYVRSIQPNPSQSTHVSQIADGWTLSTHHMISPVDPTVIHKGDGTRRQSLTGIMDTFAGGGTTVYADGVDIQATEIALAHTGSVAFDSKGNAYFGTVGRSSDPASMVWKVSPDGLITRFAGSTTEYGFSGDGGPALSALLQAPWSVTIDDDDNVYIVDWSSFRVRKVDANGIINTVIGNGNVGERCANNCKATDNTINRPYAAAVDKDGNIYVSSASTDTIGKVDANGIFTTIAGGCQEAVCYSGMAGAGMPATQVNLDNPTGLFLAPDGSIYFTDGLRDWVGKIDPSGILSVVAGSGFEGYWGDGGPATQAGLNTPTAVTLDPAGNVYIYDRGNYRIRKIDSHGIITTIAGRGSEGFSGDGAPATEAQMARLSGYGSTLTYHDDALYFADSWNNRIRTVKLSSPGNLGDGPTDEISFVEESGVKHIFSWSGRHERTVDRDTGAILRTFAYDNSDSLVAITDQFGSVTTLQYDANGVVVSITSPDGLVTGLTVGDDNHLTQIAYPDTSHYDFSYNQGGLLETKTEPKGNIFTHTFDANGRLQTASDEEGGLWSYTRTSAATGIVTAQLTTAESNVTTYVDRSLASGGSESTITHPSGNSSTVIWSADGLTKTSDLSCGMTQTSLYNIDSQYQTKYAEELQSVTPAGLTETVNMARTYVDTDNDTVPDLITSTMTTNGKAASETHDTLLSQYISTSPEGRIKTLSYDSATLLLNRTSMSGLDDITYGYDSQGRMAQVNQAARQHAIVYGSHGFVQSVTGPEGQEKSYSYDASGRMTAVHLADGGQKSIAYDANGNINSVILPTGAIHQFAHNGVNLLSSHTLPDSGGSYTFQYDNERRLVSTTFPSGDVLSNTYSDNRLIKVHGPDGDIDTTYFPGSKVQTVSRGSEAISYTYDGRFLLSKTPSGTLNQGLVFSYNNDFLLTSMEYAGNTQLFSYDNDGLLISAAAAISRNAATGLPEQVSDGTLVQDRTFNGYGELSDESSAINLITVASWNVTRNLNGNITAKTETLDTVTQDFAYTYDALGRLLTVSQDATQVEAYQYDTNGNRLSDHDGLTYTYDSQDRLLSAGTTTYAHNEDGYLTTKTAGTEITTSYSYSIHGELSDVILPTGTVIHYTYDPLGRRIAKSIDSTIVEKYLWPDDKLSLLAIYDGDDNLLTRFAYADNLLPISMNRGGITYYLIYDYNGSLRLVVGTDGLVVKKIDYDSFGNISADSNPGFIAPFGFAGGLYDQNTKLVYFSARNYDPGIGRWTAKDPISFGGGDTNLYAYVGNNPINMIDRTGRISKPAFTFSDIFDPASFIKKMLDLSAESFYETAKELAQAQFKMVDKGSNDPCHEYNMDRLKENYHEIERLQAAGASLSEAYGLLYTFKDVTDLAFNAPEKLWELAGTGLKMLMTDVFK